jgi:hypothetical protein
LMSVMLFLLIRVLSPMDRGVTDIMSLQYLLSRHIDESLT